MACCSLTVLLLRRTTLQSLWRQKGTPRSSCTAWKTAAIGFSLCTFTGGGSGAFHWKQSRVTAAPSALWHCASVSTCTLTASARSRSLCRRRRLCSSSAEKKERRAEGAAPERSGESTSATASARMYTRTYALAEVFFFGASGTDGARGRRPPGAPAPLCGGRPKWPSSTSDASVVETTSSLNLCHCASGEGRMKA